MRASLAWREGAALLGVLVVAITSSPALASPTPPDDIRDIRGLVPIPTWWHWPLAIALAAVAALAVVFFVRWWQARSVHALSPLERARRALAAAEMQAREGRSHEWADIIAETVRGALAARLGIDVLPQTTAELSKASWAQSPVADEVAAGRVLELLETCDLARFAKARLDSSALLASNAIAFELVERLLASPAPHPAHSTAQPQTVTP